MLEIVAVSTAFNPDPELRRRCELSVLTQAIPIQHIYIDAAIDGGACLENVYNTVMNLDPAAIVLWVDGDDWLASDHVVERVLLEYQRGAWMTWGQYALWDEKNIRKGHCFDPHDRRACRKDDWYASHLRTFRAGLFQKINPIDLAFEDHLWSPECCDLATMFPMLEMADDRGRFIPDVLYVYNYIDRRARRHDFDGELCERQHRAVTHFRSLPRYDRLVRKPW